MLLASQVPACSSTAAFLKRTRTTSPYLHSLSTNCCVSLAVLMPVPSGQRLARATAAASQAVKPKRSSASATRAVLNPFSMTLTAGCAALAYSGAVPVPDVAFSLAWPIYLGAVNILRFNSNAAKAAQPSASAPLYPKPWVRPYAAFAGVLAVLIPGIVCIWAAVYDSSLLSTSSSSSMASLAHRVLILKTLGPHLYLTCAQIVCEGLSSRPSVALLPRMLVPIGFNTYRMWALVDWCTAAVAADLGPLHMGLAVANLLFWTYNLFVFLLLEMLPIYLDPHKCAV